MSSHWFQSLICKLFQFSFLFLKLLVFIVFFNFFSLFWILLFFYENFFSFIIKSSDWFQIIERPSMSLHIYSLTFKHFIFIFVNLHFKDFCFIFLEKFSYRENISLIELILFKKFNTVFHIINLKFVDESVYLPLITSGGFIFQKLLSSFF